MEKEETRIERRDDKNFEAPKATRPLRSLLLQRHEDEKEHITTDTVFTSGETVQETMENVEERQVAEATNGEFSL